MNSILPACSVPSYRAPSVSAGAFLVLLVSLSALLSAQTVPAPAPPAGEQATDVLKMTPYEVNTEGDRGYGTSAGLGGTRINQPLIDSSMTIVNLNKEFLDDLGFTQLSDEVQFVSGMSSSGAQGDGRYSSRGRASSGSNFRDGMPEAFGVNSTEQVDSSLFDRIEIIKGPAGVLFGSMDLGGTVNRISKRPLGNNKTSVSASYNTLGTVRTELDTSRVLFSSKSGRLAMRFAGMWQNGQSDDKSPDDRIALNPSIEYRSKAGNVVWLYYIYQNVQSGTRDTIPSDKGGHLFPFMGPGYPYYADTSPRWDQRRIFEAGFTRKFEVFGLDSGFRIVARYLNNEQDRANSASGAYNVFDASGKLLGTNATLLWSDVNVARLDWTTLIKSEQWVHDTGSTVAADFSTKFNVWRGTHSFFTYVEAVGAQEPKNYMLTSTIRPAGFQRWPVFTLPPDWSNFLWSPAAATRVGGNTKSHSTNLAFAAQDSVSYFNNRLIVAGGARHDASDTSSENLVTPGAPVKSSSANWSTKYGAVVKPFHQEGIAFYYNHSGTFKPVTTIDSNTSSPTYGTKFPDQVGLSNEIGIKLDLYHSRVVGSLVYFDSWLTNQLVSVVAPNGVVISQPLGKVTSRGWEYDVSVQATKDISLLTSFSDLNARTITGLPLRGNPQRTVSFLGKYSFARTRLKGLAVAAGFRYAADRAGDNNATFTTPNLKLFNLNLIYVRQGWRAQVSIDNLLNDTMVTGSVDVSRIDLYNKRNVTFRVARNF